MAPEDISLSVSAGNGARLAVAANERSRLEVAVLPRRRLALRAGPAAVVAASTVEAI